MYISVEIREFSRPKYTQATFPWSWIYTLGLQWQYKLSIKQDKPQQQTRNIKAYSLGSKPQVINYSFGLEIQQWFLDPFSEAFLLQYKTHQGVLIFKDKEAMRSSNLTFCMTKTIKFPQLPCIEPNNLYLTKMSFRKVSNYDLKIARESTTPSNFTLILKDTEKHYLSMRTIKPGLILNSLLNFFKSRKNAIGSKSWNANSCHLHLCDFSIAFLTGLPSQPLGVVSFSPPF